MTLRPQDNNELQRAFPVRLRNDVLVTLSALPEIPHWVGSFTVQIEDEAVSIPNRVYHDPALIHTDRLNCT